MPRGRGARMLGRGGWSSGSGTALGRPPGAADLGAAPSAAGGRVWTPGGEGAAARWARSGAWTWPLPVSAPGAQVACR